MLRARPVQAIRPLYPLRSADSLCSMLLLGLVAVLPKRLERGILGLIVLHRKSYIDVVVHHSLQGLGLTLDIVCQRSCRYSNAS